MVFGALDVIQSGLVAEPVLSDDYFRIIVPGTNPLEEVVRSGGPDLGQVVCGLKDDLQKDNGLQLLTAQVEVLTANHHELAIFQSGW